MKNKLYLSLALLMGTTQLFGAATAEEPTKLRDITAADKAAIQQLLQSVGSSSTDSSVEKEWKNSGNYLEGKTTASMAGMLKAWKRKDTLIEMLRNAAISNISESALSDLATVLYIAKSEYGQSPSPQLIGTLAHSSAFGDADNQNVKRKLALLLQLRDKEKDAELRDALLNQKDSQGQAVRFNADAVKVLINSGLFDADEAQLSKLLLTRTSYKGKYKSNEEAAALLLESLGRQAASTSQPADVSAPAGVSAPATSGAGTSELPAVTQEEAVTELLAEFKRSGVNSIEALGLINEALDSQRLIDLNTLGKDGNNLLHWAVSKGEPMLVENLLTRGASPKARTKSGKTALEIAQSLPNKNSNVIHLLEKASMPQAAAPIKSSADKEEAAQPTPQQTKSQKELLTQLLADLSNEESLLERVKQAVASGELTDINEPADDGETALGLGALKGYPKFVKYVLEIGANPKGKNSRGKTALDYAKGFKHQEVIAILEPLTGQPEASSSKPSAETSKPAPKETNASLQTKVDVLINAIKANSVDRVRNAIESRVIKSSPRIFDIIAVGLSSAVAQEKIDLGIIKELVTAPAFSSNAEFKSVLANVLESAKAMGHKDVSEYLENQLQGLQGYEETLEGIIKRNAGQKLTHQDIRALWQQLNKGGALTADVAQKLVGYATDPEGATNREKNSAWVVSTMLIRANPKALDGLTGLSQETKDTWKRIAARK